MPESVELQELEPSPVDETPSSNQKDYFPPQTPARSNALGLGSHSPSYYLTRIQKYSSYTFTAFTAIHLTTTSIIPLVTQDIATSTTFLHRLRPAYQNVFSEPVLVVYPLAAHIVSGLLLRLNRRRAMLKAYGAEERKDKSKVAWPHLSGTSILGLVATPLVVGHACLTRGLPYIVEGNSNGIGLDFIGHGVSLDPIFGFIGYSALVSVVGWHVVWGWARWLGFAPSQVVGGTDAFVRRKRRWWVVNGLSAVVTVLWLAGGLGVVARAGRAEGWIGRSYDDLYEKIPLIGPWLVRDVKKSL